MSAVDILTLSLILWRITAENRVERVLLPCRPAR